MIKSKIALYFNSIARKAAEDLGIPGPESAAAPAEEQKAEKKGSKEEVDEVNINPSEKCQNHMFLLKLISSPPGA